MKIAEAGERLRPGAVYLAPPDAHLMVDADLRVALAVPRSAIETGCVDRVLPLQEIGTALVALANTRAQVLSE